MLAKYVVIPTLNHLIKSEPWAINRLKPFATKTVCLTAGTYHFYLLITTQGLFTQPMTTAVEANVTVFVPMSELTYLMQHPEQLQGLVKIEGEAELANALNFVFQNIKWHPEEDLAKLFGDVVAHRIFTSLQALHQRHHRFAQSVEQQVHLQITQKQQLLITRTSFNARVNEIRQLRDQVARLSKQIDHLEKNKRNRLIIPQ